MDLSLELIYLRLSAAVLPSRSLRHPAKSSQKRLLSVRYEIMLSALLYLHYLSVLKSYDVRDLVFLSSCPMSIVQLFTCLLHIVFFGCFLIAGVAISVDY